jgi:hypothetical protein
MASIAGGERFAQVTDGSPCEAVVMNPSLSVAASIATAVLLVPAPSIAQTPTAPPNIAAPQPTPDPRTSQTASAPVTLTGCLERSKPLSLADNGKTPPPTNTDPATAYVLRSEPSAGDTAGSTVVYNLISTGPAVKFEEHRGHRVQLTGTLRVTTNQQAGMSNQGVSPSTPSGSTGMETMPKPDPMASTQPDVPSVSQPIFVQSLKMLDGGCKGSTE